MRNAHQDAIGTIPTMTEDTPTTRGGTCPDPGWAELLDAAIRASRQAYAPYSNYHVGAAALLSDGETITGANVENASYGLTLCAECMIVSQAGTRHSHITRIVCVNAAGDIIAPCGRCRQILAEHADDTFRLLTPVGETDLAGMLPFGFSRDDLDQLRRRHEETPR